MRCRCAGRPARVAATLALPKARAHAGHARDRRSSDGRACGRRICCARTFIFPGRWAATAASTTSCFATNTADRCTDAFLPLESDFWNADHTRYTVFFDPGRVKRGILPNRDMGRALVAGRQYTLEVNADWPDAQGRRSVGTFPARVSRRTGRRRRHSMSAAGRSPRRRPPRAIRSSSRSRGRSITACHCARCPSKDRAVND